MRKLLNTLFVTSEDAYLTLDGENIVVNREKQVAGRFPLHTLSGILCFSYAGASPALMGECASRGINLSFCAQNGRFLARTSGQNCGNVLLRRTQYRVADDLQHSCRIAGNFLFGKVHNCRGVIERTRRDHGLRVNDAALKKVSDMLKTFLPELLDMNSIETLRGIEGACANAYFGVFDELILNRKESFTFCGRSRRPPLDRVNAMLSFIYSILANDCASALESVGLDAYVGFLHRDRPGRASLALDLMEELRPCMADRFVLTLINNRVIAPGAFDIQENGSVLLNDNGRKTMLQSWQMKKQEQITHPFLEEKMPWGLVPYIQALLLARYLRDDLESYPSFLWK